MSLSQAERQALHRLIYVSRARPQTLADPEATFRAILETAQRKNGQDGLTGGLLACEGWFLQVLEGQRAKVLTTFGCISDDRRHDTIHVIEAGSLRARGFARWSMCGKRLSPADDAIVALLEDKHAFVPRKLTPARALALLNAVQAIQAKEAANTAYLN